MPSYQPLHFIGDTVEVAFDRPPALEKKPGCPDRFTWRGQTFQVVALLSEWTDFARRGRAARNMAPAHAAVAAVRGSWGVGRYYFQVRAEDPTGVERLFELYYDRAPKGSDQRKGAWFLVSELAESDA